MADVSTEHKRRQRKVKDAEIGRVRTRENGGLSGRARKQAWRRLYQRTRKLNDGAKFQDQKSNGLKDR